MWVREDLATGQPVEVILAPKRVAIGDVNHPVALFTLWSAAERRTRCGIFPATVDASGDSPLKRRTGTPDTWSKVKASNAYTLTPTYENLSRPEVRAIIRTEARNRILDEISEKPNGTWETFRVAVRARSGELLTAWDAGTPINIAAGTINGAGAWPT